MEWNELVLILDMSCMEVPMTNLIGTNKNRFPSLFLTSLLWSLDPVNSLLLQDSQVVLSQSVSDKFNPLNPMSASLFLLLFLHHL
jgi:hypothetical protein